VYFISVRRKRRQPRGAGSGARLSRQTLRRRHLPCRPSRSSRVFR